MSCCAGPRTGGRRRRGLMLSTLPDRGGRRAGREAPRVRHRRLLLLRRRRNEPRPVHGSAELGGCLHAARALRVREQLVRVHDSHGDGDRGAGPERPRREPRSPGVQRGWQRRRRRRRAHGPTRARDPRGRGAEVHRGAHVSSARPHRGGRRRVPRREGSGGALEQRADRALRGRVRRLGVPDNDIKAMDEAAEREMAEAVAITLAAPWPDPRTAFTDVQDVGAPV